MRRIDSNTSCLDRDAGERFLPVGVLRLFWFVVVFIVVGVSIVVMSVIVVVMLVAVNDFDVAQDLLVVALKATFCGYCVCCFCRCCY